MKRKCITKWDIALIGVLLLCAGVLMGAAAHRGAASFRQPMLEVTIGNRVVGTYPLQDDREIELDEGNRIAIRDGKVTMEWADCPDQICVHSKAIDQEGGNIVCLPHQVVLRIVDTSGSGVDTVAE